MKQKELIRQAIECGDMDVVCNHYSATYLLLTLAIDHLEQGEDLLKKHALSLREIKQETNQIKRHFDNVSRRFRSMITSNEQKNFTEDWEKYGAKIDTLLGFKEE